jgi:hypothetical protein
MTAKADETATLKQKSRIAPLPHAHERHDVEVLKAKLATAGDPESEPATVQAAGELRAVGADGSAAAVAERLQPMPSRGGPRLPATPGPVCRIEWWRGSRKSHFDARVRTGGGDEAVLLTSPPFRWNESTPPPKHLSEAARAHHALLIQLEAGGWVVTGSGEAWYAVELQRPPSELSNSADQKGER